MKGNATKKDSLMVIRVMTKITSAKLYTEMQQNCSAHDRIKCNQEVGTSDSDFR